MILTEANGVPIERPQRSDFASDVDFLRAYHAYRDRIASVANESFARAFTSVLRRATP